MARRTRVVVLTALLAVAVGSTAAGAFDRKPTVLAAQKKAFGIVKSGHRYQYEERTSRSDEAQLIVDLPAPWSDIAESRFRRPDSGAEYGVGLRATTDADKFHDTFDVPGMKVTATTDVPASFDAAELVRANAFEGCRAGAVKPYDNGAYEGSYQTFSRCDGKMAAAVVIVALNARGDTMVLLAGQALTKADLAAFDRAMSSATIEKPSV